MFMLRKIVPIVNREPGLESSSSTLPYLQQLMVCKLINHAKILKMIE